MQVSLRNKYDNYKPREGTIQKNTEGADQSRAADTDLKIMIQKYGIMPFELLNKAKEPLYLNNLGESMTINEKLKMREEIDLYYENLPANARKAFNDSKENFYQSIMSGQFDKMIEYGIFEKQNADIYKEQLNTTQNKINELEKQLNEERTKLNEYKANVMGKENNTVPTTTTNDLAKS